MSEGPLSALLIGTATQRIEKDRSGLDDIPQVAENLTALHRVLTSPAGLFPQGSVEMILNPDKPQDVYDAVDRRPKRGTLLCYYSGHGIAADYRLCLALPNSIDRPLLQRATSLPVSALLEQLAVGSRKVILILDCCYAGLAFQEQYAAQVHMITAVGKSYKAKFNNGDIHTVFTGALLSALREGIADGTRHVTLESIFRYARQVLLSAKDPELTPHQRSYDDSAGFRVAPNPAFEETLTPGGLLARRKLALEAGFTGDVRWAAELAAALAVDAARSPSIDPQGRFHCGVLAAAFRGQAGDPQEAVRLLEQLLAGNLAEMRPRDVQGAYASLATWRAATTTMNSG